MGQPWLPRSVSLHCTLACGARASAGAINGLGAAAVKASELSESEVSCSTPHLIGACFVSGGANCAAQNDALSHRLGADMPAADCVLWSLTCLRALWLATAGGSLSTRSQPLRNCKGCESCHLEIVHLREITIREISDSILKTPCLFVGSLCIAPLSLSCHA